MATKQQLDLRNVDSAAEAAVLLTNYLRDVWHADPVLQTPEQCDESIGYRHWRVVCEGFHFEWGVYASLGGSWAAQGYSADADAEVLLGNSHWYGQPYCSFDLMFVETECANV